MKDCPECNSSGSAIQLTYEANQDNPDDSFKESFPELFDYDEYNLKWYNYLLFKGVYYLSIFISIVGFCSLFGGNPILLTLVWVPSLTALIISYLYDRGISKAKGNIEERYINKIRDKYYCRDDNVVYDEDGLVDHETMLNEIKERLRSYHEGTGEWYFNGIRYSALAMAVCIFVLAPITSWVLGGGDITVDNSENSASNSGGDENQIDADIALVEPLPNSIEDLQYSNIEGSYSSQYSLVYDTEYSTETAKPSLSYEFITWKNIERIKTSNIGCLVDKYKNYDGVFSLEVGDVGNKPYEMNAVGVWRLTGDTFNYNVPPFGKEAKARKIEYEIVSGNISNFQQYYLKQSSTSRDANPLKDRYVIMERPRGYDAGFNTSTGTLNGCKDENGSYSRYGCDDNKRESTEWLALNIIEGLGPHERFSFAYKQDLPVESKEYEKFDACN